MRQKREQLWWAAACVVGLLVAAWAAGGFIGPLMAVFIVLFMAGAVLVEFDGRDRTPMAEIPAARESGPESETVPAREGDASEADVSESHVPEAAASDHDSAEADLREAANSVA